MTLKGSEDENSDDEGKGKTIYGTCRYSTDKCTTLKALIKEALQKKSQHFKKGKKYTKHDIKIIVERKIKKALELKKRKYTQEVEAFENRRFSDFTQESI